MASVVEKIELDEAVVAASGKPVALVTRDLGLVQHVTVALSVDVGTVSMTLEALFALSSGDVLKMNERVSEPLTLRLDGKPVARGSLVAVDDNFGFQLTEILG